MRKEQRDKLGAQVAKTRNSEPLPEHIEAEKAAVSEDLDNPATQKAIEFPKEIPGTLVLPKHGERAFIIKTEFSYADVFDRRVLEDLESFYFLVMGEIGQYGRDAADPLFVEHNPYFLSVVLAKANVRADMRALVSKISRYKEAWVSKDSKGNATQHIRPTIDEFSEGLSTTGHREISLLLVGLYTAHAGKAKKV
jgi:hypothetical protein